MAPKGIKASKVFKRKSKAKVIEWVTKEHSRGTRDVAVEVNTSKGEPKPRQNTGGLESDEAALYETTLPTMDVDETFWTEQAVVDEQKRVSSSASPFLMASDNLSVPAHLH
jgi:hypothetical protein